ncbi:hypothetical protein [Spirulina sp. 06S082]|uniref:hypothetical protein n=1 Tax=Spirulina sp. 06S082 TaxID=3110248 RepID=UPI002B204F96|nr:hypothetical protein [Spirulina sp. 06S082]MEA5469328.1 hypothetical protein [Spirulina sp. 06S082]
MNDLRKKNDIERIQDFHKKYTNRKVREFFREEEKKNRGNRKENKLDVFQNLLLHEEKDSAILTLLRLELWNSLKMDSIYEQLRENPILGAIYGIPATDFHDTVRFKPQLHLFFRQSTHDQQKAKKTYPVRMSLKIRLNDEFLEKNSWLLTREVKENSQIKKLAKEIYRIFRRETYQKGLEYFTYKDKDKDYQLQLQMKNESFAKALIKDILAIQDDKPDHQSFFRHHKDDGRFNPQTGELRKNPEIKLFGEKVKKYSLKRLEGEIRLHYAELFIEGLEKPIQLVETQTKTGKTPRKALESFDFPKETGWNT